MVPIIYECPWHRKQPEKVSFFFNGKVARTRLKKGLKWHLQVVALEHVRLVFEWLNT